MSTEDATPDTGASDVTARPIPAEVLAAAPGGTDGHRAYRRRPRRRPPAGARRRDLRETLERIPVDVVVAVDWLEHPDLGDRFHLRSGFLDRLRDVASSRTVVVLSVDGTLRAYGPFPTPDDVDRAVRLSILIGAATAALVALARR